MNKVAVAVLVILNLLVLGSGVWKKQGSSEAMAMAELKSELEVLEQDTLRLEEAYEQLKKQLPLPHAGGLPIEEIERIAYSIIESHANRFEQEGGTYNELGRCAYHCGIISLQP